MALGVWGALVAPAVLAAGIAPPPCRVEAATGGNTIPSIAAGRRIEIALPRTGLVARRAVTLSRTDSPARGNSSVGRAAICPAIGLVVARQAPAIGQTVPVLATVGTEAVLIAPAAAIRHAPAAETGTRSEAAQEDTTDQLHAPTATAAPRAWDLEVEAEEAAAVAVVAAAVAGAGKRRT